MPTPPKTIILGIDPGIADTGYGVIAVSGSTLTPIVYGSIVTSKHDALKDRLLILWNTLNALIAKYRPAVLAVEQLFFAKNVKTALTVGQARGVVVLAAGQANIPLHEFTPLQVKVALTGYGGADKKQMQSMIKLVLGLKNIPKPDDAADALAVAVCCANSVRTIGK